MPVLSVIDRLRDSVEFRDRRVPLHIVKESIRRDLEWLLNSRRLVRAGGDHLDEASRSILAFGLPDLSRFSRSNPTDLARICGIITETVRAHEPRLLARTVHVTFLPARGAVDDSRMYFRIEAFLRVNEPPEPVVFDTSIELDSGVVEVKQE